MAKDMLEAVADFLVDEINNTTTIALLDDQDKKIDKLYTTIVNNEIKELGNHTLEYLKLDYDLSKRVQTLITDFDLFKLYSDSFKELVTDKLTYNSKILNLLDKKIVRERWRTYTNQATTGLMRLSDFKGPIQTINTETITGSNNWVGLQNENEWALTDTPSNYYNDVTSYNDENNRSWFYFYDSLYQSSSDTTKIKNSDYSNSYDGTDFTSELRYKGNSIIGMIGGTSPKIVLGDTDFPDIKINQNLEVYDKLYVKGIISKDDAGYVTFKNDGDTLLSGRVQLNNSLNINSSDPVSIDVNNIIQTSDKIISEGFESKDDSSIDGELTILNGRDLAFASNSSGITFAGEDFYRNKTLKNIDNFYATNITAYQTFKVGDSSTIFSADNDATKVKSGNFYVQSSAGTTYLSATSSALTVNLRSSFNESAAFNSNVTFNDDVVLDTLTFNDSIVGRGIVIGETRGEIDADKFNGTATSTEYADIAENYKISIIDTNVLSQGTVCSISDRDDAEIVLYNPDLPLAGVISTNPAHLMNRKEDSKLFRAVALKGRVPVKIKTDIQKSQYVIPDEENPGYAIGKFKKDLTYNDSLNIIGIALEDAYPFNNYVEVKV